MNIITRLLIKCFFKLETVQNILEQIQAGDHVRYLNGKDDIKFIITHINKERNEIVAKTNFRKGYSSSKSFVINSIEDVHTYIENMHIFKNVVVEEEICSCNEDYKYSNFKTTATVCNSAKGYFRKVSAVENTLFIFCERK